MFSYFKNIQIKFEVIFPDSIDTDKKELIYKLLPRRSKLKENEVASLETYPLDSYANSNHIDTDSDDDGGQRGQGVQCAQQ